MAKGWIDEENIKDKSKIAAKCLCHPVCMRAKNKVQLCHPACTCAKNRVTATLSVPIRINVVIIDITEKRCCRVFVYTLQSLCHDTF